MNDYEVFDLGNVVLQEGAMPRDAKLAYKSHAIAYPTWYSGRHWENELLIGEGMALDPSEYFVIVPKRGRFRLCPGAAACKDPKSLRQRNGSVHATLF